jgi:hypothetical protein
MIAGLVLLPRWALFTGLVIRAVRLVHVRQLRPRLGGGRLAHERIARGVVDIRIIRKRGNGREEERRSGDEDRSVPHDVLLRRTPRLGCSTATAVPREFALKTSQ